MCHLYRESAASGPFLQTTTSIIKTSFFSNISFFIAVIIKSIDNIVRGGIFKKKE